MVSTLCAELPPEWIIFGLTVNCLVKPHYTQIPFIPDLTTLCSSIFLKVKGRSSRSDKYLANLEDFGIRTIPTLPHSIYCF